MKRLPLLIGCLLVIFLAAGLLTHRNLYPLPNPDIFHYASDGQIYMSGSLPDNIHVPPGSPLLIGFLSSLPGWSNNEVALGIDINLLSTIGSSILLLLILNKISFWLIVPVLLVVTINPLVYIVGVDTTSEALFSFVLLLCLWLLSRGKYEFALVCSWLSFFVRYAGVGLICGVLMAMVLRRHPRILMWITASMGVLVWWLLILSHHNNGSSIADVVYVQEMLAAQAGLPHLGLIRRLMMLFLYDYLPVFEGTVRIWVGLITLVLVAALFARNAIVRAASIFSLLYILGSVLFPHYAERYSFPLIWTVPLVMFYFVAWASRIVSNRWIRSVGYGLLLLVSILLAWSNYQSLTRELALRSGFGVETRATADWLNQADFEKPSIFLTLEPWKLAYYVENADVEVVPINFGYLSACSSMVCLADLYGKDYGQYVEVYLDVTHVYMLERNLDDYWLSRYGIGYFHDFGQDPGKYGGSLVYSWQNEQAYVRIYRLTSTDL